VFLCVGLLCLAPGSSSTSVATWILQEKSTRPLSDLGLIGQNLE
jgi:hypothetical protein